MWGWAKLVKVGSVEAIFVSFLLMEHPHAVHIKFYIEWSPSLLVSAHFSVAQMRSVISNMWPVCRLALRHKTAPRFETCALFTLGIYG